MGKCYSTVTDYCNCIRIADITDIKLNWFIILPLPLVMFLKIIMLFVHASAHA